MEKEKQNLMEEAKRLVEDYCHREFGEDAVADFTNLAKIPIAYTTSEDDQHEIQVYLNLLDYNSETFIDGNCVWREQYENLEEMVADVLPYLDFDDLVSVSEELDAIIENAKLRSRGKVSETELGREQEGLEQEQGNP